MTATVPAAALAVVREQARRAGLAQSDWFAAAVYTYAMGKQPLVDEALGHLDRAIEELRNVSILLNQIARALNGAFETHYAYDELARLIGLRPVLLRLQRAIIELRGTHRRHWPKS